MAGGGVILRVLTTLIRGLQFLASIIILGIFSYFLAVLSRQNSPIATFIRAVEGLAGAAALYTLIAIVLTCFLGGVMIFAFTAIILDICFIGCFIAITVLTKDSLSNCAAATRGLAIKAADKMTSDRNCALEKTVCILAIICIGLFIISALMQLLLGRHHQREKRFGPGPSNNYTSGEGKKSSFGRKTQTPLNAPVTAEKKQPFWKGNGRIANDTELGTVGARPSHDTALTGSTVAATGATYGVVDNKHKPGHGSTDYTHQSAYDHPSALTPGHHGEYSHPSGTTSTNYEQYSEAPEATSGHHGGYTQPIDYAQPSGMTSGHHNDYSHGTAYVQPSDITTTNQVGYEHPQGYSDAAQHSYPSHGYDKPTYGQTNRY